MQGNNRYQKALGFTLEIETGNDLVNGGYTNDPDDPGGETKWGISKRANPDLDIKNLTLEDAINIYYHRYWVPLWAPPYSEKDSSWAFGAVAFDSAVHHGVGRVRGWMRQASQTAPYDWRALLKIRKAFVEKIVHPKYIKGWRNRLNQLDKYATILEQDYANS